MTRDIYFIRETQHRCEGHVHGKISLRRISLLCRGNWNTYVINDLFKKACEQAPGTSLRFIIRSIPALRYLFRVLHSHTSISNTQALQQRMDRTMEGEGRNRALRIYPACSRPPHTHTHAPSA